MNPHSGDRAPHQGSGEGLERAISVEEARLAEELAGLSEEWGVLYAQLNEEEDAEERSKLLGKVDALWQRVLERGRGPLTVYAGFTQLMAVLLAGGAVAVNALRDKLLEEHARITAIGEARELTPPEQEVLGNLATSADTSEGLRNLALGGAALEQIQVFGLLVLIMVLKGREQKP